MFYFHQQIHQTERTGFKEGVDIFGFLEVWRDFFPKLLRETVKK